MNRIIKLAGSICLLSLFLISPAFTSDKKETKKSEKKSEDKTEKTTSNKSFHDFKVKTIEGKEVSLKDYKGKAVLIVNVASNCGYTKQYKNLVELSKKYKEKDFAVLAFPANNFGKQEPGTDSEIKKFASDKFEVKFPMFSKVSVKGKDQVDLFKHLTNAENPDFQGDIKWNFEKFLINKEGKLVRRFRTKVTPDAETVTSAIDAALEEISSKKTSNKKTKKKKKKSSKK